MIVAQNQDKDKLEIRIAPAAQLPANNSKGIVPWAAMTSLGEALHRPNAPLKSFFTAPG